ncbi:hypothetical protein AC579_8438 [Pseudocercospora musae]|uniref:Uncharacterized protein n=1 Tax=Pseudocercospora musae TaxID=113226 RepID=A0A139I3Y3_9PEZI|nr:hypothetical protein AC579_8438 [Pseudocercospora musae]
MDREHPSLPPRNPARLAGTSTMVDAMPAHNTIYVVSSTDALIRQSSRRAVKAASPPAQIPCLAAAPYSHMERWQRLKEAGGSEPPAHWQVKHVQPLTVQAHHFNSSASGAASTASTPSRPTGPVQPDTPLSSTYSRRDSAITLDPPAPNDASALSTQASIPQYARPMTSTSSHPPRSIKHLAKTGDKGFWRDSTGELVAWRMYLAEQEPKNAMISEHHAEEGTSPIINPRRSSSQIIKEFTRQSLETLRKPVKNRLRRRKASEALSVQF